MSESGADTITMDAGGVSTVNGTDRTRVSSVALIVVLPGDAPITMPLLRTVATAGALDVHCTEGSGISRKYASYACTVMGALSPTSASTKLTWRSSSKGARLGSPPLVRRVALKVASR